MVPRFCSRRFPQTLAAAAATAATAATSSRSNQLSRLSSVSVLAPLSLFSHKSPPQAPVLPSCISCKQTQAFLSSKSERTPAPRLPSSIVTSFWEDVMKYAHSPGSYSLGQAASNGSSDTVSQDSPIADKSVRNLISGVIKAKREHGDIWPSLITRQCCEFYESLDLAGRGKFLLILAKDFNIDLKATATAVQKFEESMNKADRSLLQSSIRLREALTPAYDTLFSRINQLPGGMQFLVNMRADIMLILAKDGSNLHLRALSDSLKNKLQEWFGTGFLDLERITWSTPVGILEQIVKFEAVHQIPSWDALKQRLGDGRLCYAFFHRGIPQVPLTFVQVALVKEISTQVQDILNDRSPGIKDPKVAIFYSISSSQRGLTGVDLGNFLIKRVVKEVQLNHPTITTFCTLSPIPGFRSWLQTAINTEIEGARPQSAEGLLLPNEHTVLKDVFPNLSPIRALQEITNNVEWLDSPQTSQKFRPIIERLCSRYLVLERKRVFALDPVANFHIRNGAMLHQINWAADTSAKGAQQSFGMMVNYLYDISTVESNNQKYLLDGHITISQPVQPALAWAHAEITKLESAAAHNAVSSTTDATTNNVAKAKL